MKNKVIHSTRVHASHLSNLKKAAAIDKLKRRPVALAAPDPSGKTKELNWGALSANSVLTLGDFDSTKFGLNEKGQIIPITSSPTDIIEQNLSSDLVKLNIRRLDDTIVYTAEGKGNSVPGQKSIEFNPGDIDEKLLPDEPVVVNMRTADGESDGFTEIHPGGEVVVYTGKPGDILAEDIPMTASTIKMDDGVIETYFDTPHLKIRCRLDEDVIIQYEVVGKHQTSAIPAMTSVDNPYVELREGSLGIYTPKATGPVIALRTIDGNCGAYCQFNTDGSVKLYVPHETNFADDDFKTTAMYMNIIQEEVIQQTAVGDGLGIIQVTKDGNTIIFDILTKAGTTLAAGESKIVIDHGVFDKVLYPDMDITVELPTDSGVYGLYATYMWDGTIMFTNANSVPVATTNSTTPVTGGHINKEQKAQDQHEQRLEDGNLICVLRKDFNNVTAEVTTKTIPTSATRQTIELFPPGTIEHEFLPEKGERITTELSTEGHKSADAFTSVLDNGALVLTKGPNAIDAEKTTTGAYIDLESTDTVLAEVVLEGEYIDLVIHRQGDLITYMCFAIEENIPAGNNEFRQGSVPKEMCPDEPILIELPVANPSNSNSYPCYIGIGEDGSVLRTEGRGVDVTRYSTANSMRKTSSSVKAITLQGPNIQVTAKKSDETLTYDIKPLKSNVPAGQTYELFGDNVLPSWCRPDYPLCCWVPSAGNIDNSGTHAYLKTSGEISLYADGAPLLTGKTQTVTELLEDEDDPYCHHDDYTIQVSDTPSENGTYRTSVRKGKGGMAPEGMEDFLRLHIDKVGACIGMVATPCVTGTFPGFPSTGGNFLPIAQNFLHDRYLPRAGESITLRMITVPPGATTSTPYEGKAVLDIDDEGTLSLKTNGDVLAPDPNGTVYVDAISQDLVEKEYDLSSFLATSSEAPEGVGDWLKATFRKIKNTVVGILRGQGTLSTSIAGQELQAEFAPDKGVKLELNPGKNKGFGSFEMTADGKFKVNVGTALHFEWGGATTDYRFNGAGKELTGFDTPIGKCFTLPFIKYGDGDIFNDVVTLGLQGKHRRHILYGEGHMYYSTEHISQHGVKSIISRRAIRTHVQPEGFMDFLSMAGDFISSNIDLRAIGSSILQGGASIVGGLISGKGFGDSVSGAFKEIVSGGLGSYLKPDGPVGSAMGTIFGGTSGGGGVLGGVMKMLPSGGATVIGKGLNFLSDKFPFAGSYINKAKSYLGDREAEVLYSTISAPHSSQTLNGELDLYAVRYGMDVTYSISCKKIDKNGLYKLTTGIHLMKGLLKESLRPDSPLVGFITPTVRVSIGTDGQCSVWVDNAYDFGGECYTLRAVKEYRPYGWNFAELAKQAKPKRKYNKRS